VSGAKQARFYGLLALATVVAGCGGSGYTKSDFVARANAICTSTLRQTRALTPPASTSPPAGALAAYLRHLVPLVQSEVTQLRGLKRPDGTAADRATLTRYLAALGQVVTAYRELERAAKRGDAQTMTNVEAALRASPVAALATSYGLRACSSAGATAT
jgi:hypothetical protein